MELPAVCVDANGCIDFDGGDSRSLFRADFWKRTPSNGEQLGYAAATDETRRTVAFDLDSTAPRSMLCLVKRMSHIRVKTL